MRTQLVLACAAVVLFCGGSFAVETAPFPHEPKPKPHYIARVTADDKGKIEKITLTGPGIEKELDFKADTNALYKKLKELAANHDKPVMLTFEIADELLQAYVVKLIDGSIKAGFEDVSPVPIDKSKR